jgi:FkbM family methyltransferase
MFAIYAARELGASEIVSLEPNPHTFAVLRENVNASGPGRGRIALHNAAVTFAGGNVQMLIKDNNKTSVDSSIVFRPAGLDEPTHLIDVPSVSIADAINDHCDFLKFDAEGIEYDVLLHDVINPARVSQIVAEVHSIDQQPQQFYRLVNNLNERGYTAYDTDRQPLSKSDIEAIGRERSTLIMHFS